MRKAVMILLALLALRLLPKAVRREARALELFTVLFQMAAMAAANTSKAYSTEKRVSTAEQNIGGLKNTVSTIQGQQGTFSGFSGSNNSYSMGGGTEVTYDPSSSGNEGGNNSHTSGQIGGAAAHYHDMTHHHSSSGDLQNVFNALQSSFADVDGRLNSMYAKLTAAGIL